MTYTEFNRKQQVQQQDHSMNRLMMAMEEDLEDEVMEEALAVVKALAMAVDLLPVTTMEL